MSAESTRIADHEDPAAPANLDITRASIARVYDYVLGGKDNFEIDRTTAHAIIRVLPEAPQIARDNRAFVRRSVRYLAGAASIRQIIDIGCGLPTEGNVHEVAHEVNRGTRVVYVDNDPIVLAHGRALLADNNNSIVITSDVRDPESLFNNPAIGKFIDRTEPYAVLISAVLHHLSDDEDPWAVAKAIRDWLPSGSYLMIANFVDPGEPRARATERAFLEGSLGTGRFRTLDEQTGFFEGLEMVEPGLVPANEWRPDPDTETNSPVHNLYLAGVGRKP